MKKKVKEEKGIVYITGNRNITLLDEGDKVDLDFNVHFSIEIEKEGKKKIITVKDVKIDRREKICNGSGYARKKISKKE